MAIVSSPECYLDAGLEVLADVGYGGLKLVEVCRRLGVTTGSFYHWFSSWQQYTSELGHYWMDTQTDQLIGQLRQESNPRRRLEQLARMVLAIPHRTEAAIRSWAAVDPEAHAMLSAVDHKRLETITDVIVAVLPDADAAQRYANWLLYLLVGYQDALTPYDFDALVWATQRIVKLIEADRARLQRAKRAS